MSRLANRDRTNLPTTLTSFIGREAEIAELTQLLSAHRLLTLTGPGGCGKTRLAISLCRDMLQEFVDGVWFSEFASLRDPSLVPQEVASTLGVYEAGGNLAVDVLVNFLRNRSCLLVFDNCEHLIEACSKLAAQILQTCPRLKILVTSREPLGVAGENLWSVPPLSLPPHQPWKNPADASRSLKIYELAESVMLFVTRASALDPQFALTIENGPWIAEICRRLDGMPLAIELAAARVRSLSVEQIGERLQDRFKLLTKGSRDAPPRQQTLAATLDWSYALLSDEERRVLQRLSVCAGGATLEAAESVCEDIAEDVLNALSRLVDKSLVNADRSQRNETRYHLLATIRQYGLERLAESGSSQEAKSRHLDYFTRWAEQAEPNLSGTELSAWLNRYEAEHDNLRAAFEFGMSNDSALALRLAAACGRFWRLRGHISEGRMHLAAALSKATAHERTITRARALVVASNLAYLQADYPAMHPLAKEALSIWRELGERGRTGVADSLVLLGGLATEEGDYAGALAFFHEAMHIYEEISDSDGVREVHMQLGWAATRTGKYEQAQNHFGEFLSLARQSGDQTHVPYAYSGLGEAALRQGQHDRALTLLEQGLTQNRERGDTWGVATMLGSLAWLALEQHDLQLMRSLMAESLSIRMNLGDKGGTAWCLEKLAEAKYIQGEYRLGAKIFGFAEALRAPIGSVIDPVDQSGYDRTLSGLRSALGVDAFEAHWAAGKAMRLEDVIELALAANDPASESMRAEKDRFGGLTAREREAARLIAQGRSNREIAKAMTVGIKTVETYVTRILHKLNLNSRVQIATWAIEKGLHSPK